MSIRVWAAEQSGAIDVQTDQGVQTFPVVTQEDLIKALVDAAIVLDRAGGSLGVVLKRVPSGLQDQMVTTEAYVQWQERTNAKRQPEPSVLEERHEQAAVEFVGPDAELAAVANGSG